MNANVKTLWLAEKFSEAIDLASKLPKKRQRTKNLKEIASDVVQKPLGHPKDVLMNLLVINLGLQGDLVSARGLLMYFEDQKLARQLASGLDGHEVKMRKTSGGQAGFRPSRMELKSA